MFSSQQKICFISFILITILSQLMECEESVAQKIRNVVCDKKKKDDQWARAVMCCQRIQCYKLKKETELNIETRDALYKEFPITEKNRKQSCAQAQTYIDKLKDITADLRGDMFDECSSEEGVGEKMAVKVKCFDEVRKNKFDFAKETCPDLFK